MVSQQSNEQGRQREIASGLFEGAKKNNEGYYTGK